MTNELNRNPFDTDIQSFSKDKFVVYLNNLLAIENLSENRVQSPIESTLIEEVRQILECHLERTKEQQLRLRQFITKFGEMPTVNKAQSTYVIAHFSIQKELQKL
jgi:ferritin-like metal-binding protein YciE